MLVMYNGEKFFDTLQNQFNQTQHRRIAQLVKLFETYGREKERRYLPEINNQTR